MKTLSNELNYLATLTPLTPSGKPALVDGEPVWSLDNEDAGFLEVADDGKSAKFVTADTGAEIKVAKLTITADADLGDGVKTLTLTEDLVVGPPEAESLGISFGEGTPK